MAGMPLRRRTHGIGEEKDAVGRGGVGCEGSTTAVEAHLGTTRLDSALLDQEKRAGARWWGKGVSVVREEDHGLAWASAEGGKRVEQEFG